MLMHPTQTAIEPTVPIESISPCAHHCRLWLAVAHPALLGRAYEVALRGYERWRLRHDTPDSVDAFARYLLPRHDRWLAAVGYGATLAPCLVGGTTGRPCWKTT